MHASDRRIVRFFERQWRGLWGYYKRCDNASRIAHVLYLLKYSCAMTLSRKYKKKYGRLRKVFRKYGKDLTIREGGKVVAKFEGQSCAKEKSFRSMRRFRISPLVYLERINRRRFRSLKVLRAACIGCGATERVEMHHVRKLRDLKGKSGLTQRLSPIKRKQVPLCRRCHLKVHAGKYNGPSLR